MQRHNQKNSILCKRHKVSLFQSGRPIESVFFREQILTYHGSASTSITQPFLPIGLYRKYHNTLYLSFNFCINIVSISSWDLHWSQEKRKTRLSKNLDGQSKEPDYGIFERGYFVFNLLQRSPTI